MNEPTDAELFEVIREAARGGAVRRDGSTSLRIARAVLAKWGTPSAVAGEPAQWQKRHQLRTNGEWENTNEHDAKWWRDNSQGWEIRALYTPQPTQPQSRTASAGLTGYTDGD